MISDAEKAGLRRQLIESLKYDEYIEEGARIAGVDVSIIWAIGSRESAWGLALRPPGPAGTGDWTKRNGALPPDGLGWGRGLMQIDYASHEFARTGAWKNALENILYGSRVLRQSYRHMELRTKLRGRELLRAGIAGYNAGPGAVERVVNAGADCDKFTAHGNYGRNVLERAEWFAMIGGFGNAGE